MCFSPTSHLRDSVIFSTYFSRGKEIVLVYYTAVVKRRNCFSLSVVGCFLIISKTAPEQTSINSHIIRIFEIRINMNMNTDFKDVTLQYQDYKHKKL